MKAFASSLVLVATVALTARADFTIVQKVEGKGQSHEIALKIKGDKIRMEATPQMTMIVDGKTGDTITLMNTQKKIVRISGDNGRTLQMPSPSRCDHGQSRSCPEELSTREARRPGRRGI